MQLESIFASLEFKNRVKEDSFAFEQVDKFFQKQMVWISKNRTLNKCIREGDIRNWRRIKESLVGIQKTMDLLLEDKRHIFPRFYFFANNELLEILAKPNNLDSL